MHTIVVATGNRHKIDEIASALSVDGFEFKSIYELIPDWPSPVEDADSFEGNSAIKARAAFEATGLPSLADDSGLAVDVLNGEPGVYSARYAGEGSSDGENNDKLLQVMDEVDDSDRSARFVSVLVLIGLDTAVPAAPSYLVARGTVEGKVGRSPRGNYGFGYDPLFLPEDAPGRSMAELTMDEKNAISHRGNALRALKQQLDDFV